MIRVRIPNDNSCLFTAIDYLIHGTYRPNAANELREKCAQSIIFNPEKFNSTYLNQEPSEYCRWILLETSWGGEIEINILSELFHVSIIVIPLETLNPLRYSPLGSDSIGVIFLLYTGQHYDAIISESLQTLFPFHSQEDLSQLEKLVLECCLFEKNKWELEMRTRTRKRIRCNGCGALLENGTQFQIHCEQVDHSDDFCYDCEEVDVVEIVENATDD